MLGQVSKMSPMDIAFQLLKEDPLDTDEKTPIKDEKIQYKFFTAGPYWTLNNRQKQVADALLDLPSAYLSEEGWKGDEYNHLFGEGHENVPDYEYDRLERALVYFKDYINQHMSDPNSDKSPQFLDDTNSDHPDHPWARAKKMAYKETEPYDNFSEDFKEANKGEPMDIAFQLLKERVSPEAKRRKLEYDKKYESSPERVKYREDLNRERRKRGIYGSHDHMDVSHTKGGKLTLEGEHANRARHFKEKGTLRDM